MKFRYLNANDIECRVATVKDNGCSLLLYKDARCDMRILDETVGAESWQRSHELINGNLFCNVGIKVGEEWVWKQDVGTESYTEKEKGQASDSFKRACFNWGIGRELYTAPFIWIDGEKAEIRTVNGKSVPKARFSVSRMEIENGEIVALEITNTNKGTVVFNWGKGVKRPAGTDGSPKAGRSNTPEPATVDQIHRMNELVDSYADRFESRKPSDVWNSLKSRYRFQSTSEISADVADKVISCMEQLHKERDKDDV